MGNMDPGKTCPPSGKNTNTEGKAPNCQIADCPHYGNPGCVCRIRTLNDEFRTSMRGGIVQMTNGIAALGPPTVATIFQAISNFTAFDEDNDPWVEHDCASLNVQGHDVLWKIGYYDQSLSHHSPDAADPSVTVRVLIVMLIEEY